MKLKKLMQTQKTFNYSGSEHEIVFDFVPRTTVIVDGMACTNIREIGKNVLYYEVDFTLEEAHLTAILYDKTIYICENGKDIESRQPLWLYKTQTLPSRRWSLFTVLPSLAFIVWYVINKECILHQVMEYISPAVPLIVTMALLLFTMMVGVNKCERTLLSPVLDEKDKKSIMIKWIAGSTLLGTVVILGFIFGLKLI